MAIQPDLPLPHDEANYTPGQSDAIAAWKERICVVAGDRIELVNFTLFNPAAGPVNLQPDGTAGFGAGFMPHWTYIPKWAHKQDLNEEEFWAALNGGRSPGPGSVGAPAKKLWRAANGNIGAPPVVRVDLTDLYCPWDGVVGVQGGMGPTAAPTSNRMVVSYIWDQSGRVPRQPVDTRVRYRHRLTFRNPFNIDGFGLPITIPVRATKVWTETTQTLKLDNGAGTFGITATITGEGQAMPTSGFTRVLPVSSSVPDVIFEILL
jgi:hypothetical protein